MRRTARRHEELAVWQDAMLLVEVIYRTSANLPVDEKFGLIAQMRRAAVSVPSNIAEGAARHSTGEFIRFLLMARGSLSELDTQVQIARRLDLLSEEEDLDEIIDRTLARLSGLIRTLRSKLEKTT